MNKEILVISYYANMPGACQAEWVDDRINSFIDRGYEITLLSSICTFKNKKIKHIRIPTISPHGFIYEFEEIKKRNIKYSGLSKFIISLYYLICKFIYQVLKILKLKSGEGRWTWFVSSFIVSLFFLKKYEFIYSTGGPASPHLTGILLKKILGIRNLSEFQDPLSGEDIGRNKFAAFGLNIMEKFIIKESTKTIYCTKNAMKFAQKKYIDFSKKIDFVYPGSNVIGKEKNKQVNKKINITYLGSLYQSRNLDNLIEALFLLKQEGYDVEKLFEINLYGNIDKDILKRIKEVKYKIINIHGLIDRDLAMKKASESDVLLLVQNTDNRSIATIPFKTYDYLHTGVLVLGLLYKNDELENMLNSHGHVSCNAGDINSIKLGILKILNNKENTKIEKCNLTPDNATYNMLRIIE